MDPFEFINQKWYHIEWFEKQQTYVTEIGGFLSDEEIRRFELGWWLPSNPQHSDYPVHALSLTLTGSRSTDTPDRPEALSPTGQLVELIYQAAQPQLTSVSLGIL
jgi:hypothetical protein